MWPRLAQRSHTQTNSAVIIGDRYPADQVRHASHPWNIAQPRQQGGNSRPAKHTISVAKAQRHQDLPRSETAEKPESS
jgi:hypothetical protein